MALNLTNPAFAQEQPVAQGAFVVDLSDPNVSVDLSVLNDGGLAPQMGAPAAAAMPPTIGAGASGLYQAPGPNLPVSTLYIQPSGTFTLPPQTKSLIAVPQAAPQPEDTTPMDVAEQEPVAPVVAPVVEAMPQPEAQPEAVAEAAPIAVAPVVVAPVVVAPVVVAPVVVAPVVVAPVVKRAVESVKAEPAPEPAPAPAVEAAPVPAPVTATAEPTPPPPPQALTKSPEPVTASVDETQNASQAAPKAATKPGAVVVDLPPKLEETQPGVASLPSPTGPLNDGDSMRIVFEHDSSKLPSDVRDALKALSERMNRQDTLRLQLLAYAGDTETSASAARRLSLSRALAVRSYLIENGVRSTRIDVRALGNKSTEAVTERVDITVVER